MAPGQMGPQPLSWQGGGSACHLVALLRASVSSHLFSQEG